MLSFLVEAVLISLSGVLAPGPMTAVAVGIGSRNPYAGITMTLGHAIVEIPLMAALILGAGPLFQIAGVRTGIGLVGGALLLAMGIQAFRTIRTVDIRANRSARSPIAAGILLSIGNPYFLVWWATVGFALLIRAADFGRQGLVTFACVHLSCDLVWLTFLSTLAFAGANVLGRRFQQAVLVICGLMLLAFGFKFVAGALNLTLA